MPARNPWTPGHDPLARLADAAMAMTAAELERFASTLDSDDLALLEEAVASRAALGWRTDPATMAAFLDPTFKRWRYVRYLSEKFREAANGTSTRQIWNLPARFGKSVLGSQWGPTWILDYATVARFLLVSYGAELALENAVGIRDRLEEHAGVLRCRLRRDRRRMNRFLTEDGGGVVATGINGSARGFGAGAGGGLIVDDPFKDWQEAHSPAQRDRVWNQFRGTLLDRLDDEEAFILIIHHRVHADDLTGRLLEDGEHGGEEWDVTTLPALAVAGDVLGRQPGEALEPERFSVAYHVSLARAMGSYLASSLQQQDPQPEEGNELLREWFRLDVEAEGPPAFDNALTSWDLKLKDREAGDYVVGQAWWRTGPDYWLQDQLRGQYDHATTANAIALLAVRNPLIQRHVIEAAGSADEVVPKLKTAQPEYTVTAEMAGRLGMTEEEQAEVQALRRRGLPGVVTYPAVGDKSVRIRTYIAPTAEAGNVHLPAYKPWTPILLDELASFPGGANDDQCLAAATEVMTPTGPTRIAAVTAGAVVLGGTGWVRVLAAGQTGVAETESRYGIRATPNHPIATARGWVPFHSLRDDDMLWTCVAPRPSATGKPRRLGSVCGATPGHGGPGRESSRGRPALTDAPWMAAHAAASSCGDSALSTTADGPSTATPLPSTPPNAGPSESRRSSSMGSSSAAIRTRRTRRTAGITSRAAVGSSRASKPSTKRSGKRLTARSPMGPTSTTATAISPTTRWRTWSAWLQANTPLSTLRRAARTGRAPSSSPTWTGLGPLLPPGTARPRGASGIASTPERQGSSETGRAAEPVYNLTTTDGTFYADGLLVHNCDAMSQALQRLGSGSATISPPSGQTPRPPVGQRPMVVSAPGGRRLLRPLPNRR